MKIDFDHPANEAILRFLRNSYVAISGPKAAEFHALRERDLAGIEAAASPESVPWQSLGTHPDIIERFWRKIAGSLPEPCQWVVYGKPALVHPPSGVIFGWAGGNQDYSLRLPRKLRENGKARATLHRYSDGSILDLALIGEEWFFGDWSDGEERLCLEAYHHAARLAQ